MSVQPRTPTTAQRFFAFVKGLKEPNTWVYVGAFGTVQEADKYASDRRWKGSAYKVIDLEKV